MKPLVHSRASVARYGGKIEDYLAFHEWMDSTKAATANFWHRAILHNSFGIFLGEQHFGSTFINSDGKTLSVRDILEDHVKEDFGGKIPSIDEWFVGIQPKTWMFGKGQKQFLKNQNITDVD